MKKIIEYRVIIGESPVDLAAQVTDAIENLGFQPYGSMVIRRYGDDGYDEPEPDFIQPIVRYEE